VAVVFVPALGVEGGQHLGPGRGAHRRGLLQGAQAAGLLAGGQRRPIGGGQPAERGLRHRGRVGGGGGRGGWLAG